MKDFDQSIIEYQKLIDNFNVIEGNERLKDKNNLFTFLTDSKEIKFGGEVPITSHFSVSADYIQAISRKGNGAELKLNYAF